jgi:hypothetical protein
MIRNLLSDTADSSQMSASMEITGIHSSLALPKISKLEKSMVNNKCFYATINQ